MAFSRRTRSVCSLLLIALVLYCSGASANAKIPLDTTPSLSIAEIEDELQKCPLVEALNVQRRAESAEQSSLISRLFAVLFPGTPAVNALLATLYISGPPNFLLALCPPNIDPSSLSVMVAFAVGGLMGDTLFHLLPEIFLGEDSPEHVRFVYVEPKRNLLLGLAIMVGFMTFVAMDKSLRIATGGEGHDHGHSHSHAAVEPSAAASGADIKGGQKAKQRKSKATNGTVATIKQEKSASSSVKLGAYLNLIADFTHNITDGLAMSASFYTSPTIGATTTMAVFFHEIPHEVGDFALLIQSGFSKRAAMGAQFVTAIGALLGTGIGIAVQEYGGSSANVKAGEQVIGLLGTSLQWGDLLLPFTAGTFLYVGTVAVIPEMLEVDKTASKSASFRHMATQFAAVAAGAGIMLAISW